MSHRSSARNVESEVYFFLLVDTEYSSIQPATDDVISVAVCKFNKGDHPPVYSTLQTYLADSFQWLNLAVKESHAQGLSCSVKIVRWARKSTTLHTICDVSFGWVVIDLQCCNYSHLPIDFSCKFQSSVTILHHKLLTRAEKRREGWVFANGSAMTIFVQLFIRSVIWKVYHSNITYHVILHIIFSVAASLQAPSPIHSNIEETHRRYNSCVSIHVRANKLKECVCGGSHS